MNHLHSFFTTPPNYHSYPSAEFPLRKFIIMGSVPKDQTPHLVYDVKLSSVVPAGITGDDKIHPLKNMDLIMKYHYLKGVYFFNKEAAQGFSIQDLKKSMFFTLELFYYVAGRIRRADDDHGGEFIKCNDSGVRVVEAKCRKTLDQWMMDRGDDDHDDLLVYDQVLGPDFGFSPLVYVQYTWFQCGGISIGLSWAHILGDAFTASEFINLWGRFLTGNQEPSKNLAITGTKNYKLTSSLAKKPCSIKLVDHSGDQWLISNNRQMRFLSTNVTAKQLNHLLSKIPNQEGKLKPFEVISAVIWKSLAKIRGENEPKVVTICTNDTSNQTTNEISSNSQVISTVEAPGLIVSEANLLELAETIANKQVDERSMIEELMDNDERKSDFLVYGANLTFVDLEDAKFYDMELKGHKPVFANYRLSGVEDEGTVMVLPLEGEGGRLVNLILPEDEVASLKYELRKEWGIF